MTHQSFAHARAVIEDIICKPSLLCFMLPSTLTGLLVSLLHFLAPNEPAEHIQPQPSLQLELRHLHAVTNSAHVIFSDVVQPSQTLHAQEKNAYTIHTRSISTFRPPSMEAFTEARTRSIKFKQTMPLKWEEDEVIAPDIESRETLLELAKMTNNAYVAPDDPAWYDLGGGWNSVSPPTPCPTMPIGSIIVSRADANPSLYIELSLWLGIRRGWVPWPCFRYT